MHSRYQFVDKKKDKKDISLPCRATASTRFIADLLHLLAFTEAPK